MVPELFFDVETTGLPSQRNARADNVNAFEKCRVVSIAWCLRDTSTIYSQHYHIVDPGLPRDAEIGASFIHGITRDMVNKYGIETPKVLKMFMEDVKRSATLVAHNVAFDLNVMASELFRYEKEDDANFFLGVDTVCTMKTTTNLVKIPSRSRYGASYKWPKLSELHKFLFGTEFENQHNALADVDALIKCYYELKNINIKKRQRLEENPLSPSPSHSPCAQDSPVECHE